MNHPHKALHRRSSAFIGGYVFLFLACLLLCACPSPESQNAQRTYVPRVIGSRGLAPGQFSFPRGLDVDRAGRLAVADKSGRIQVLSPAGEALAVWRIPKWDNGTPTSVVFDETDQSTTTLLVVDTHNSRVFRYSLGGRLLATFGHYGGEPGRMIYPTSATLDPQGNIYLTEYGLNDRVLKFDRTGKFIKQWGGFGVAPGQFQRPVGLVFAPPDRIIVADSCNHRLQVFSTEGELREIWGGVGREAGQFNYPYDVTVDGEGRVFVTEYGNNRVQCLDKKGQPLALYGGPGHEPGQFAAPWCVTCDAAGHVFVADTNNHRLQAIETSEILRDFFAHKK